MADKRRAAKPGGVKANPKPQVKKKSPGSREPVREAKIDRNAPCPCGSGKKYKKCCAGGTSLWKRLKSFVTGGKKESANDGE